MTRHRKRRRNAQATRPTPSAQLRLQPTEHWHPARMMWGVFLAFCTIIGLNALWPRIVVEPIGQIDPSDPHPIIFKITNTGFMPLWNVQPGFGLCEFATGVPHNPPERCQKELGSVLIMPQWHVSELSRDEPTEIRFDELISLQPPAKFADADISVVVTFYPWFMPNRMRLEYRFQTRLEEDGKLSWVPRPLNK